MSEPAAGNPRAQPGLPLGRRATVLAALLGVAAICWLYLWLQAGTMSRAMPGMASDMKGMAMPATLTPWSVADAALTVALWWIMMLAMMLPSAAPMVMMFAAVNRSRRARGRSAVPTAVFATGYALAWGGFGVAASFAQWALERAALIAPQTLRAVPVLGAAIAIAAGLYQLTPLKTACLVKCRSPFDFVLNRWRDGALGALRMGLGHGLYCLGCCWTLMALLFAGGAMSLLWMAALTGFVLAEKLAPAGLWLARAGGVLLLGFGAYLLLAAG
jgi:predicted metal-binding membrane protein